jgi:perosamine synthetase
MVTTADAGLAELAWSLRHYGRTRKGLWYEHARLGWHYRMTELQGALLLAQLEKMPEQLRRRERNARALQHALRGIPGIRPCRRNPETEADVITFYPALRPDAWDAARRVVAGRAQGIPPAAATSFPT